MKHWTDKEENELIELCLSGARLYMIRKIMHVCDVTLNKKLKAMGLNVSLYKHGWTVDEWKLLNDMSKKGHNCSEITQALNTNYDRVFYALQLIKGVVKKKAVNQNKKKQILLCGDCDQWQMQPTRTQLYRFGTCSFKGDITERCDFCKYHKLG